MKLPNPIRRSIAGAGIAAAVLLLVAWSAPLQARRGMPRTQRHESRHEIDQLEDEWRDALLKGDTAVMNSLLADDYMAITAFGTLQTKDETLAQLRSGRVHITTLEVSDRKVRFYGTTALVTSYAQVRGTTPEGDISGDYRYTRVYVRNPQGKWMIVNFEASKIGGPNGRKRQDPAEHMVRK